MQVDTNDLDVRDMDGIDHFQLKFEHLPGTQRIKSFNHQNNPISEILLVSYLSDKKHLRFS